MPNPATTRMKGAGCTVSVYVPADLADRIDKVAEGLSAHIALTRSGLLRLLLRTGCTIIDEGRMPDLNEIIDKGVKT